MPSKGFISGVSLAAVRSLVFQADYPIFSACHYTTGSLSVQKKSRRAIVIASLPGSTDLVGTMELYQHRACQNRLYRERGALKHGWIWRKADWREENDDEREKKAAGNAVQSGAAGLGCVGKPPQGILFQDQVLVRGQSRERAGCG